MVKIPAGNHLAQPQSHLPVILGFITPEDSQRRTLQIDSQKKITVCYISSNNPQNELDYLFSHLNASLNIQSESEKITKFEMKRSKNFLETFVC